MKPKKRAAIARFCAKAGCSTGKNCASHQSLEPVQRRGEEIHLIECCLDGIDCVEYGRQDGGGQRAGEDGDGVQHQQGQAAEQGHRQAGRPAGSI